MADTSIVSRVELEAIASTSGFAVWELEQIVADGNFVFLVEEFRAGRLGQVVNPLQAPPPPSVVGQATQAAAVGISTIGDALETGIIEFSRIPGRIIGVENITESVIKIAKDVKDKLASLGLTTGIIIVGVGLAALYVYGKARG